MLSLKKNNTHQIAGQPKTGATSRLVSTPLSLVKQPRASHPIISALVQLLARQVARDAFERQASTTFDPLQ